MADLNEQIIAKTESIVEKLQTMYDSLKGGGGNGDEIFKQFCERSFTEINFPKGITTIGKYAFCECDGITTVTIPNSITAIGEAAFRACNNLESVVIGDGVTSIGDYAFNYCSSLENVVISDSVTSIGNQAFWNCSSLESITIPDNVTSIGDDAFVGTAYYNNKNNWVNEVLYIDKHLIEAKSTISGEHVTKDGTLTIASYAFRACSNLESVVIGDSITSIGYGAFHSCSGLVNVTIPDSVTTIGDYAFYNCSSLTSITIPHNVTSIGNMAYYGCKNLEGIYITNLYNWCNFLFTSTTNPLNYAKKLYLNNELATDLIIPNGIIEIRPYAFYYCESLKSLTLPDNLTTINSYAFYNCSNLESITIPISVTSIGYNAFSGCGKISDVYYAGSESKWKEIQISTLGNSGLTSANIHYNWNS